MKAKYRSTPVASKRRRYIAAMVDLVNRSMISFINSYNCPATIVWQYRVDRRAWPVIPPPIVMKKG